ncbi:MAG: nucleoside deaminase [Gammaproteobacteria bacterium]|nr:nucleoside deaminase [Gammaproteobacteria bacterium]
MNTDLAIHEQWLRRVIAAAAAARAAGNHPFAAIIVDVKGTVLAAAYNAHHSDRTGHAEMMALRQASASWPIERLRNATLYTSAEPCAMCAGAAYWTGICRVVYALSEQRLLQLTGNHPQNPTLSLPCRQVFAAGQREVEVMGPMLEDEAAVPHEGFWY